MINIYYRYDLYNKLHNCFYGKYIDIDNFIIQEENKLLCICGNKLKELLPQNIIDKPSNNFISFIQKIYQDAKEIFINRSEVNVNDDREAIQKQLDLNKSETQDMYNKFNINDNIDKIYNIIKNINEEFNLKINNIKDKINTYITRDFNPNDYYCSPYYSDEEAKDCEKNNLNTYNKKIETVNNCYNEIYKNNIYNNYDINRIIHIIKTYI